MCFIRQSFSEKDRSWRSKVSTPQSNRFWRADKHANEHPPLRSTRTNGYSIFSKPSIPGHARIERSRCKSVVSFLPAKTALVDFWRKRRKKTWEWFGWRRNCRENYHHCKDRFLRFKNLQAKNPRRLTVARNTLKRFKVRSSSRFKNFQANNASIFFRTNARHLTVVRNITFLKN